MISGSGKKALTFLRRLAGIRWIRFGIVGVIATVAYYLLGLLFVIELDFHVLLGNALAYALSFIISYIGQSLWTFEATGAHARMLPRFALVQAIGLGLNTLIIKGSLLLHLPYQLAMIAAIALTPIAVYFLCKFWVFAKAPKKDPT